MGEVITLGLVTKLDIPVERVLEGAKTELKEVVLCGWDQNGKLYFASSMADGAEVLWLLEKCKSQLLENIEENNPPPTAA